MGAPPTEFVVSGTAPVVTVSYRAYVVSAAAERLGITLEQLSRLIRKGLLDSPHPGYVTEDSVEWLSDRADHV